MNFTSIRSTPIASLIVLASLLVMVPIVMHAANTTMPTFPPPGTVTTNVAFSVRVVSDQPVVAASNFQFDGKMPNQCSLLPK